MVLKNILKGLSIQPQLKFYGLLIKLEDISGELRQIIWWIKKLEAIPSEEEFALKKTVNAGLVCMFYQFSFYCVWLSDSWVEGMRRWQQWRSWLNSPAIFSASQSKVCPCDLVNPCSRKWISSGCLRAFCSVAVIFLFFLLVQHKSYIIAYVQIKCILHLCYIQTPVCTTAYTRFGYEPFAFIFMSFCNF